MSLKLQEQWAEVFTLAFIILGFILSLALHRQMFNYISIVLAGLMVGRILYIKRFTEPILPFILIIIGFLLGYLLGSFWTSRFLTLTLFILSAIISYYLHLKKIFVIFKSQQFIK